MRVALSALFMLASLPLAAWNAPSQNVLNAVLGQEPQATILQCVQPLPPTREEARSSGIRYQLERAALKRALVYRTSQAKADRGRITAENNRATALLARHLGAPDSFVRYLELLADGNLSRRQEYAVEQALRLLLQETYTIDTLQIRLVSESLQLPAREHTLCMLQLPVGAMFDMVPGRHTPRERLLSDITAMSSTLGEVERVLSLVRDAASAESAVSRLQALIPIWETTAQTRLQGTTQEAELSSYEKWAVEVLLTPATRRVLEQRRRLHQAGWFGSSRLQTVDELLR